MLSRSRALSCTVTRRTIVAAAIACGVASVAPALAEIKGLEIIAPAGPGGGYDQLARATQEMLQKGDLASGVQVQNIPGAGGHLTVATGGLNEMAQQIQAGKLRALGISSPERLPGVDIPTFKEQGLDVTLVNWRGLMAPAKMKPAEKKALDAALGEMVKGEGWQALLKERGWVDMYQSASEFAEFLGPERARIEGILKNVGLVQ